MPFLFPQTEWYMIIVAVLVIPLICLPNSYLMGMTDIDCSAIFAKLPLLLFAWGESIESGVGIVTGLAIMGVILSGSNQAALLLQDFKTGYYTEASPKAMLIAQVIGTMFGIIICPGIYFLFWYAFDVGTPHSTYKIPYAYSYRGIAEIGAKGLDALPKYATYFMAGAFVISLVVSISTDLVALFNENATQKRITLHLGTISNGIWNGLVQFWKFWMALSSRNYCKYVMEKN